MAAFTGKKITTGYARQLAKNYKQRKRIESDSQGVWFSKIDLIALLELENDNITGIRFYFGTYGTKAEHANVPLNKDDYEKNTLVMVQTGKVNLENDLAKDPIFEDILENSDEIARYPQRSESPIIREVNDGQLCPPPPLGDGTQNDLLFGINP